METGGLRAARKKKKGPQPREEAGGLVRKAGGALLSHAPGRSTIAAGALNVRVREGNGCDSPAKATGHKINNWKRKKGNGRRRSAEGAQGRARTARRAIFVFCLRPRPRRLHGMAGGGAGKPHGLSEPVC